MSLNRETRCNVGDYILVTTSKRGVFCGLLVDAEVTTEGLVCHLRDVRMCLHWPNRGVHSIQTRTDFEGFQWGEVSPQLRIPYVDSVGPISAASAAIIREAPTHVR